MVRLAFIQPYENVNGEGLHGRKQLPLAQLQMLREVVDQLPVIHTPRSWKT